MKAKLSKAFEFSASYSCGKRVMAHNYRLEATWEDVSEQSEPDLDRKIQNALIQKIHSRDLGQDVDFLRGVVLTDVSLLEAFWPVISEAAKPAKLTTLSLERDARTRWTLTDRR
jgi:hypothetical protein